MVTAAIGWRVIGLGLLLPWITWMPIWTSNPHDAVTQTPLMGFALGGLLIVTLIVGMKDAWAGALGGYAVLRSFWPTTPLGLETVLLLILGLVALIAVQQVPLVDHGWLQRALELTGVIQAVYVLVQWSGYDPIWAGWTRQAMLLHGTLGNPTYTACFLAILVPVVSWPVALLLLLAIVLTQSAIGILAAVAGLLVVWYPRLRVWIGARRTAGLLGGMIAAFIGLVIWQYPHVYGSWITRWLVWESLLIDQTWWSLFIGHGFGSWASYPRALRWGEVFVQAHNEYLQLFYEGGLVALLLVAAWFWAHQRAIARSSYAGAVMALGVTALTMFPFHLAVLSALAVIVLGAASAEGDANGMA